MLRVLKYVVSYALVLCDLHLTRFDLTKGLLFDTFFITVWYKLWLFHVRNVVVVIIQYWSLNHQWIDRQTMELEIKRSREWSRNRCSEKKCTASHIFLWNKMCRRQDLSNKMLRRPDFWTKSGWALCPIDIVCNLFFLNLNHSSEFSFFN